MCDRIKFLPGRRATPLRCWSDVVPAQDVANRPIRDSMTQIGQRTHDAVISPAAVLARPVDYQRLHFRRDPWAAGTGTTMGPVELLRYQSSIPGQKGSRLGSAGDILQSFAAQSFGDLGQSGSLGIGQAESGWQVCSENAILGRKIFVPQQQFLID